MESGIAQYIQARGAEREPRTRVGGAKKFNSVKQCQTMRSLQPEMAIRRWFQAGRSTYCNCRHRYSFSDGE